MFPRNSKYDILKRKIRSFSKWYYLSLLLLVAIQGISQNSITLIITKTPSYTPLNDTLYLSTSMDNWDEANKAKRFKLYPDGFYRLNVNLGDIKSFEYKINRGNWEKVEGNKWGDYIPNRKFTYNDSTYEQKIEIVTWQDLHQQVYPQTEVIVTSVPENTPKDASIYLTGTFNNWIDKDDNFKLQKEGDGTYRGKIPAGYDSIAFKFIRGGWESIECRWDGGMLSNRTHIFSQSNNKQIVASIDSWQDLSTQLTWLKTLYLVLVLQSLLFLGFLIRHAKNPRLISLVALISVAFFIKFFYLNYDLLPLFPKAYFVPAITYGFICTLGYNWLRSDITKEKFTFRFSHILPFLPLLWYVKYIFTVSNIFYLNIVNNEYINLIFMFYGYSIILQFIYISSLIKLISNPHSHPSYYSLKFYKVFQLMGIISVLIYGLTIVLITQDLDIKFIADWLENFIWIAMGIVLINCQWFFFLNEHKSISIGNLASNKTQVNNNTNSWIKHKSRLTELMLKEKIYTNPELSLTDLAEKLGTNSQYISKLINEEFKKNFTDFINNFRIEAFIEAVKNDQTNNTFLHHAYKVGFNSKSAFNRSFKKKKQTTPSQYFATQKEPSASNQN